MGQSKGETQNENLVGPFLKKSYPTEAVKIKLLGREVAQGEKV